MKLNTEALSNVKLGNPLLAAGTYYARVIKTELSPNKAGTGNNLNLQFKLHGDSLPLYEGGEYKNPGMVMFGTIGLVPSEKYNPNKNLKELAVAATGNKDFDGDITANDDGSVSPFHGADIKIRVKYVPANGQYGEKNEVQGYLPILAADQFNPSF